MMLMAPAALAAAAAEAAPFSFVAYGDTAYMLPRDTPRLMRMIDAINAERPSFAIHVGDFKGYSSCSDEAYRQHGAAFARHRHALILAPGDNDWFDCNVDSAGRFEPLERLGALRRMFFASDRSLGSSPIALVRQSMAYPENARWSHGSVLFATVHAFGPHNGLVRDQRLAAEAIERSRAGEAWIRDAFRIARDSNSPALVIAFQADPWWQTAPTYESGPFDWLRNAIGEESANYPGQVLVVHGDSHRLTIDTPYRRADIETGTTRGLNVTRLQVPGWPDHRAVRVDVDPQRPGVFAFRVVMDAEERSGAKP